MSISKDVIKQYLISKQREVDEAVIVKYANNIAFVQKKFNLKPFKTTFLDYSLVKTLKFIIFALDFN